MKHHENAYNVFLKSRTLMEYALGLYHTAIREEGQDFDRSECERALAELNNAFAKLMESPE